MNAKLSDFYEQNPHVRMLAEQIPLGRFPHALLVEGDAGVGKRTLSGLLAQTILCSGTGSEFCGKCTSCVLCEKNEHPDLIALSPEFPLVQNNRTGNTIAVDDIREIIRVCGTSPYMGSDRVVVIQQSDRMTEQAQNCLLKTLEEPRDHTFFILTAEHAESLLPTVRSRCHSLHLNLWNQAALERILREKNVPEEMIRSIVRDANGSVGMAIKMSEDQEYSAFIAKIRKMFFCNGDRSGILGLGNEMKDDKQKAGLLLRTLESDLSLLLRHRVDPSSCPLDSFPDPWVRFSDESSFSDILQLFEQISIARKRLQSSISFQIVLEQLLLCFVGEYCKWQK